MSNSPLAARRLALQFIAAASVVAGGATLWTILDPVSVRATETWILLSVLGLFILPVGTIVSFEADRRARARSAREAAMLPREHEQTSVLAYDIAGEDDATARASRSFVEHETAAVRHSGRKMVSARRPARSAPGRSRASTRR
ncbi:MAG: hypothetical protein KF684_05635 [Phycisphaeraceae bacterium]|nr:hypothetical protein [Phycisphaeraceae bacterium]